MASRAAAMTLHCFGGSLTGMGAGSVSIVKNPDSPAMRRVRAGL